MSDEQPPATSETKPPYKQKWIMLPIATLLGVYLIVANTGKDSTSSEASNASTGTTSTEPNANASTEPTADAPQVSDVPADIPYVKYTPRPFEQNLSVPLPPIPPPTDHLTADGLRTDIPKIKRGESGEFDGTIRVTNDTDAKIDKATLLLNTFTKKQQVGFALIQVRDLDPGDTKTCAIIDPLLYVPGPYTFTLSRYN